MNYLKINLNNDNFIEILKFNILNKIPLSFSRFGDGEINILNNNISDSSKKILADTWGYENVDEAQKEIKNSIDYALKYSDIIGLMDKNNEVCKYIDYNEAHWSISLDYLKFLKREKIILIADHMLPRSNVLGNIYNFKKIINNNPICIISPRSDALKNNNIEKILEVPVNFINVPMGIKLSNRKEILNKIVNVKELIVLFGCSVTGKDFSVHLANAGKIAIDFGATLDAWAGIKSRGWFEKNNIQEHCMLINGE